MATKDAAVCVLSPNPGERERIRQIIDEIGTYPCVVASSSRQLDTATRDKEIRLLLLDRALASDELAQLESMQEDCHLATFGIAKNASNALQSLESIASYQLRQSVARKDLETLFAYLSEGGDGDSGRAQDQPTHFYRGLVGDSEAIQRLRCLIAKVAHSRSTVLISGETGTGKEIVARNIHYQSALGVGPFVPVNCSAIPSELLESEMFGHRKGAFTGALSDRDGRFAMAASGTLFLDEIGDMSLSLQAKLLRVLEERVIYRVGCNKPIPITARVIAATHRDLEESIESGSFREDLYYRLDVVPITIPPLRERTEDIPLLVHELGCRLKREQGITISMTPDCIRCLQSCDWPGNVRELANLVERLAVFNPNSIADIEDLPKKYRPLEPARPTGELIRIRESRNDPLPQLLTEEGLNLRAFLQSMEAELIRQALTISGGRISRAANLLHIGRTTLSEKIRRFGLSHFVARSST